MQTESPNQGHPVPANHARRIHPSVSRRHTAHADDSACASADKRAHADMHVPGSYAGAHHDTGSSSSARLYTDNKENL